MYIKKINLTSFGRYQGDSFEFKDGINIVTGKNESGKTTMYNFVVEVFNCLGKQFGDTGIHTNVTDYRPWYNQDRFEGNMDVSYDGQEYILFRNFLQDNQELFVRKKDGYKISNEEMDSNEYDKLSKRLFIDLYGISNLNSDNFEEIIKETKNQYVSTLNANDLPYDYDATVRALEKKIKGLDSDTTVAELEEKLKVSVDEKATLTRNQDNLKRLAGKLFELKKNKESLEAEIILIEDSIKADKHSKIRDRYNKVIELGNKIDELDSEINGLEIFNSNSMDIIDQYIKLNTDILNIKSNLKNKHKNIDVIQKEIDDLNINVDEKVIKQMSDGLYANDFVVDYENYLQAQSKIDDLEKELDEFNRQIELEVKMKHGDINKYDIEKDYFEALNNRSFLTEFGDKKDDKKELMDNEMSQESLILRRKPLYMYLVVSISVFVIFLILSIMMDSASVLAIITNIIMGVAVGAIILIIGLIAKYSKDIDHLKYVIEHLNNDYEKDKSTILQYTQRNQSIFAKYHVTYFEEFEKYYLKIKDDYENNVDVATKVNDTKQRIELTKSNKNMLYRRIVRWIDDTQLNNEISVEDGNEAIKFIEEFSRKCVKYVNNNNSIARIIQDINTDEQKIDKLIDTINYSEEYRSINNLMIEDVVGRRKRYFDLAEQKELAADEQMTYLQGKTIDELKEVLVAEASNIANIDLNAVINQSYDQLKDMLSNTKSRLVEVSKNIDELTIDIRYKSKEVKKVYEVNKRINDYKSQLDKHNREVLNTKSTLEKLKAVAEEILSKFDNELLKNANQFILAITDIYEEIRISSSFSISLREKGRNIFIPVNKLSLGTKDLVNLVLKFALIKTVNTKEIEVPLVLDDAFIQFDDERIEATLKAISNEFKQIIIISGQSREYNICTDLNLKINELKL